MQSVRVQAGLACIDQQRPVDVCHHCIVLQGIIHIPSKFQQLLNMLPQTLMHQLSLHSITALAAALPAVQSERHTDRQTNRHTGWQTYIQTDRQTDRQNNIRQADRQTDGQTDEEAQVMA